MPGPKIALYYDDDAYVEKLRPAAPAGAEAAWGLMGRQVAGKEFLDAYLTHGAWNELAALVRDAGQGASLLRYCAQHASSRSRVRGLRVIEERHFHQAFFGDPAARLLHLPCPPDARFAWARQHFGPAAFALSGVTHTLSSLNAVNFLCGMVTAPFEPFDSLICTSRAVMDMVRAVTGTYADYLRERHGGTPGTRIRLETIPLGVDTDRFRPPTAAERQAQRHAFHIADDEVAVLFVGRLSHHSKGHPFPMFHALAQAAAASARKVHLLLAGWAVNAPMLSVFSDGGHAFAPNVRLSILDGTNPQIRAGVWHAADLFTSLVDSIQETFGLVVAEAMASGLPVVAADWNGYRDLVVHGDTGFLAPTAMVAGATHALTARLLAGEIGYDSFLAECGLAVQVDSAAAAAAFTELIQNADRRRQLGAAGRERALAHFAWPRIIHAYEQLWLEMEQERQTWESRQPPRKTPSTGPAAYPAPEISYAGYPSRWLNDSDLVQTVPGALERLDQVLAFSWNRLSGPAQATTDTFRAALAAAAKPGTIADLLAWFGEQGASVEAARMFVAWMLKFDLLRVIQDQ